jgi:hypothetical protein
MNKSRFRNLAILIGALALLAAVIALPRLVFGRLDFFKWDPPAAGSVLAQRRSPDSTLVATVTATPQAGHYMFALTRDGQVVASREISAPVGYHEHIVRVEWVADGSRAIATIDADFGDNNVRVALQRPLVRRAS